MRIQKLYLLDGAREATGYTVIIDVYRAFTVANYVFSNGAEKMILVADPKDAFEHQRQNPDDILIGERGGKIIPGFHFGNSPTEIEHIDFTGQTIIHTTTNGTQGVLAAAKATEIITGSFTNAAAIARYLAARVPDIISIVAMGFKNIENRDEDSLCADYIESILNKKPIDFQSIVQHLLQYESTRKFFDPLIDWAPERDYDLCTAVDRFSFVLRAIPVDSRSAVLEKIELEK